VPGRVPVTEEAYLSGLQLHSGLDRRDRPFMGQERHLWKGPRFFPPQPSSLRCGQEKTETGTDMDYGCRDVSLLRKDRSIRPRLTEVDPLDKLKSPSEADHRPSLEDMDLAVGSIENRRLLAFREVRPFPVYPFPTVA
jgi:hypothetical protein